MEDQMEIMEIKVDQAVYDEVDAICKAHGTTVEAITEWFIRFCADHNNLSQVKQLLGIDDNN